MNRMIKTKNCIINYSSTLEKLAKETIKKNLEDLFMT